MNAYIRERYFLFKSYLNALSKENREKILFTMFSLLNTSQLREIIRELDLLCLEDDVVMYQIPDDDKNIITSDIPSESYLFGILSRH